MKCKLLDVFALNKLSGNGLTVFYDYGELSKKIATGSAAGPAGAFIHK